MIRILTASLLGWLTLFGVVQAPLSPVGATIYNTSSTDTIGTFRTNVNNSLTNINSQVTALSSTVAALGTLSTENVPLATNKGGTGTTTAPSDAQFLGAVGSQPTWKTLVAGGGVNISTGSTSTVLSSPGIDTSAAFSWSGTHTFSSGTVFNSQATFNSFPVAATSTPTSSLQLVPKAYVDLYMPHYTASDNKIATSTGEKSTTSLTPYKVTEVKVYQPGTVRVKFTLKAQSSHWAYGRIYVNGSAVGTSRSTTSTSPVLYSEDIAVSAGDLVQGYLSVDNGSYLSYMADYAIYADSPTSLPLVNL